LTCYYQRQRYTHPGQYTGKLITLFFFVFFFIAYLPRTHLHTRSLFYFYFFYNIKELLFLSVCLCFFDE
jgi:hypothetical protein